MTRLNFPTTNIDATSKYTVNGVTYSYDPIVNTWTGEVDRIGPAPPIGGFPIDIPGIIPNAKVGLYESTDCIVMSLTENGTYSQRIETTGQVDIYVKWKESCLNQVHNTTIIGTVTYSVSGKVLEESSAIYVLKRIPNNRNVNLTNQELDVDATSTYIPSGYGDGGETTFVYGSSTSSDASLAVGSNPTTLLPISASAPIEMSKGDAIQVTQKTASTTSTEVTTILTFTDELGTTEDRYTFKAKTKAAIPSIETPAIVSPADGATGISLPNTLGSTPYTPLNGASLTHESSDWEVYLFGGKDIACDVIESSEDNIASGSTGQSEVTLEGNTNLNSLTVGDKLTMLDENGNVGSYTPTTSEILDHKSETGYEVKAYPSKVNTDPGFWYRKGWNDGNSNWTIAKTLGFGVPLSTQFSKSLAWLVKSPIKVPLVINRDGSDWGNGGTTFVWSSETGDANSYVFEEAYYVARADSMVWTYTTKAAAKYWLLCLDVGTLPDQATEEYAKTLNNQNVSTYTTVNGWNFYDGINGYTALKFDAPNPDLKFFQLEDEVQPGVYVVQVDVANNLMETTLGSYKNKDGTGDPGGDTKVSTIKPKSGIGKYNSTKNTNTVVVDESNGEWIGNDNSNEGTDYSGASAKEFSVKGYSVTSIEAPTTDPPGAGYTPVILAYNDTSNLESLDIPDNISKYKGEITAVGESLTPDYAAYVKVWNLDADREYTGSYPYKDGDPEDVFDGDEDTKFYRAAGDGRYGTNIGFRFTPPAPISVKNQIELKAGFHEQSRVGLLIINGEVVRELTAHDTNPKWFKATYSGPIHTIELQQKSENGDARKTFSVTAFKIDDEYLIGNSPATHLDFDDNSLFEYIDFYDFIEEADVNQNVLDGVGHVTAAGSAEHPNRMLLSRVEPNWNVGNYVKFSYSMSENEGTLFSRVKYRSDDPIESDWSEWHGITTEQ